jgi:cation:H+ antiporter
LELVLLLLGLIGLWLGTDLALDGALDVSRRMGVSTGFVGLTLLAVGTGLPELVVGLDGGLQRLQGIDASGVVVGNAVGSAIAQGALVLGIAGLISFLSLAPRMIRRDGVTLLLATLLLGLLGFDGEITRTQGGALLVAYAVYFTALLQAEKGRRTLPTESERTDAPEVWRTVIGVVGGLGLVVFSAELVVSEAITLSTQWGVSQTLVGIFLVGVGTSLPELVLSVRAALRGEANISVGNIIGSNTFDLLVPVGASAVIFPLAVDPMAVRFDLPAMALITIATIFFFIRKKGLLRGEALALLSMYGLFVVLRLWFA